MAIQITLSYAHGVQSEIWMEGPFAAAGIVLDAMLNEERPVEAIEIVPNAILERTE
jgi:hypothetical protein